jgi:hypothetical protein
MFYKGERNEMLKKGDKVVMHTCSEAEVYKGKIWTVASNVWKLCGTDVVMLEGFSGAFAVKYLQKVDVEELTRIKEIEVYDNGYARIEYQNGETKVTSKVVYMDAILTGVTECDDDETAIDHSKVVLHQKEDGTVQLRDDISFLWCACGNPAVEYVKENESPYQYLCNKCFKKLQEQLEAIDRLRK